MGTEEDSRYCTVYYKPKDQRKMAKVGTQADFKELVVHTQCIMERHVRAGRVTEDPSSQRVCICGFCRAWPAHLICGAGKGNGPWHTTLETTILIVTSCWWDKSKLSYSWKSEKWPGSAAGGASALGESLMQTTIFQFQNVERFEKSVLLLQLFQWEFFC